MKFCSKTLIQKIKTVMAALVITLLYLPLFAQVTNSVAGPTAAPFKWQQQVLTPIFWVASIIGSVALSVVGNLLTPKVAAFITRRLRTRRSGLRQKQLVLRDRVITLQKNVHRRTSAKLDAILFLMVGTLMAIITFAYYDFSASSPQPLVRTMGRLLLMFGLLFGAFVMFHALRFHDPAWIADRRDNALDQFLIKHGPASDEEVLQFEDEWDLQEFGVNSKDEAVDTDAKPVER